MCTGLEKNTAHKMFERIVTVELKLTIKMRKQTLVNLLHFANRLASFCEMQSRMLSRGLSGCHQVKGHR